jgi:hypothetical protein
VIISISDSPRDPHRLYLVYRRIAVGADCARIPLLAGVLTRASMDPRRLKSGMSAFRPSEAFTTPSDAPVAGLPSKDIDLIDGTRAALIDKDN